MRSAYPRTSLLTSASTPRATGVDDVERDVRGDGIGTSRRVGYVDGMLIGSKVRLRAIEREDLPAVVSWFNDPEAKKTIGTYKPVSLAEENRWFDGLLTSQTDQVFIIDVPEDGAPVTSKSTARAVGLIGLHRIDWKNRHCMVGILIGKSADRNRGFGTDAMRVVVRYAHEELGLMRVWLDVMVSNANGIKSYENVGFVVEGKQRNATFRDGRFQDLLLMSCLFGELKKERA